MVRRHEFQNSNLCGRHFLRRVQYYLCAIAGIYKLPLSLRRSSLEIVALDRPSPLAMAERFLHFCPEREKHYLFPLNACKMVVVAHRMLLDQCVGFANTRVSDSYVSCFLFYLPLYLDCKFKI